MSYSATETNFHDRDQLLADLFLEQVIGEVLPHAEQYLKNTLAAGGLGTVYALGALIDDIKRGERIQWNLKRSIMHFPAWALYLGKREPDLIGVIAAACGGLYREL